MYADDTKPLVTSQKVSTILLWLISPCFEPFELTGEQLLPKSEISHQTAQGHSVFLILHCCSHLSIALSCVWVTIHGVWIGDWITEHFQIVTTSNYSTITNSRTQQFTTAYTTSSQFVFINRFLVTDPNNVSCLRPYRLANVSQLTKL
jgi:hypothetical protein